MLFMSLNLSFISAYMFTMVSSPLGLGIIVIIFSFFISMSMSLLCVTSWFSLLLFMLFLSGMMIIFVYICSLASNENYFYSISVGYLMLLFSLLLLIYPDTNKLMTISSMNYTEMDSAVLMYKVYSFNTYMFAVVLIIYLLITLLAVVKLSVISESPLRSKK
uniref:NADH dehydrogenase subunit 6 n=1 Tax=Hyalella kochi TaxID=2759778 RepID=A0A7T8ZSN7_9CRUS|nr:NADH dehydrogenase subunit 6 [Hyalella kochi]